MRTLIITIIAILAIMGWNSARAEKPVLQEFTVAPYPVPCPDAPRKACKLITNGVVLYIVKGAVDKEETIWEVDQVKILKANELTDMKEYTKVIWMNPDGMI